MSVESHALLSPHSSEDDQDLEHQENCTSTPRNSQQVLLAILATIIIVLCALLIGTNVAWAYAFAYVTSPQPTDINYYGADDIQTAFHFDWVNLQPGDNETRYGDPRWEKLFPRGGGRVALSQDTVENLSLPASVPAAQDPEKRIYQIAGYHQLHCLDKIRDVLNDISDLQKGVQRDDAMPYLNGSNWDHVLHCTEGVRQGLVCRIDETLLPVKETWPPIGDGSGQLRTCKNATALRDWAERNIGSENRQWTLNDDH